MPIEADLIVENGTGLAAANTYVSLATSATYHALRGNEVWAEASESDRVVALVRSSQYIDTRWKFQDEVFVQGQGLIFPRAYLFDRDLYDVSETVPVEIEEATCEYALAVLGDGTALVELSPVQDQSNQLSVTMQRDKVGDLETETRYDSSVGARATLSYPKADRIIRRSGYTLNSSNGSVIR